MYYLENKCEPNYLLSLSPLQGISVAPLFQDFTKWHGNLAGPQGTPYEGGVFHFSISFASDHPRYIA